MQWAHPGPGGGRQTVPITRISWAARKHLYCWPHSEWVTACCSSEEVYYLSRIRSPPLHPNNYLVLIPGLEHFNLVIPKCWIIKRVECVSEQQALQGGNRCYLSVLTKHPNYCHSLRSCGFSPFSNPSLLLFFVCTEMPDVECHWMNS